MPESNIDTTNVHGVAVSRRGVSILNPPRYEMTTDQALTLAAWLVALSEGGTRERFLEILEAVENA